MVDSVQVWPPGFRVTDSNDDPVPLGTVEFYDAGTTDAQTVYSDSGLSSSLGSTIYLDSGGCPVASSGSSTKVPVYVGDAAYKVIIKDADANVVETKDNLKGALDTATFEASSIAIAEWPVAIKSADYTVLTTDRGNILFVDSTSATRTLTMPSAVSAGNGWCVIIQHGGISGGESANKVTINSVSSQTFALALAGGAQTSFQLTSYGEATLIVSNGANFHAFQISMGLKLGSGYHVEVEDLGTVTSGTITPDPEDANVQKLVNNGAFTLAKPGKDCNIILKVTNDSSAGAITTSAYDIVDGDTYNTTNTNEFFFYITEVDGAATLTVKALQ